MRKTVMSVALAIVPGLSQAQQGSASASASATANANVQTPTPTASFSAESRAKIDAAISRARAKNLPEEPMQRRIAEGQAKGASEAQVVASAQKLETRLEATQSAMVRAGRAQPPQDEVARGEQAMERGVTEAQIEALVKHSPSDRSLVVAFDVLTKLTARGVPVANALAQIESKLDARASDDAIGSLVAGATVGAAHGPKATSAGAAVTGNAASGVGAAGKGVGSSVTAGVAGAIGVKKP